MLKVVRILRKTSILVYFTSLIFKKEYLISETRFVIVTFLFVFSNPIFDNLNLLISGRAVFDIQRSCSSCTRHAMRARCRDYIYSVLP